MCIRDRLTLALAAVLALSLVACGGSGSIKDGTYTAQYKEPSHDWTEYQMCIRDRDDPDSLRGIIGNKLLALPDEDLEKVSLFIEWIKK